MPAFSPTDAYREAAGFPRQYGAWTWQQFQDALERMNRYGGEGDRLSGFLTQYMLNQLQNGYASPDQIRAMGEQIMPGLGEMLARRGSRLDDIQSGYNNRYGTGDAMSTIYDNLNGQAGDIGYTQGAVDQDIMDTFMRGSSADRDVSNNILGDIGRTAAFSQNGINDTFGGLRSANAQLGQNLLNATNQAYGAMRGDSDQTFSGLESELGAAFSGLGQQGRDTFGRLGQSAEDTYTQAIDEAERLRPGSDLWAARVGRNWAPVVAQTGERLRRAGAGPNSLQGISMMSDIAAQRARAMDDAVAQEQGQFADRMNSLRLGRQGSRERLGLGELSFNRDNVLDEQSGRQRLRIGGLQNRQGLTEREQGIGREIANLGFNREADMAIGQNDRVLQSTRDASLRAAAERARSLMNQQGLDANRSLQAQRNLNDAYANTTNWRNAQNNAAMARRGMELDDWNTQSDLFRERNNEDLVGMNLRNQQYQMGQDWMGRDIGMRDAAAGNLANLMNTYYGQRGAQTNAAMGFGNQAQNAYGQTAAQEAGRGGWGWGLIGGVAQGALSMIPGVGPMLGNFAGGITNGVRVQNGGVPGARGGGFNGGGSGYGQFNWQSALQGWRNNQSNQQAANRSSGYWRGGQMRPDGSFQVTR